MWSSTASTAEMTKRHPVSRSTGSRSDVIAQVLDLDGDVVAEAGEPRRQRLDEPPGVRRAVEEIGIAERDVLGPALDLRGDVGQRDVDRDDAELPAIDRHDRAMAAQVLAAARRLGVADHAPGAVGHLERRVAIQRGQIAPVRGDEPQPRDGAGDRPGPVDRVESGWTGLGPG